MAGVSVSASPNKEWHQNVTNAAARRRWQRQLLEAERQAARAFGRWICLNNRLRGALTIPSLESARHAFPGQFYCTAIYETLACSHALFAARESDSQNVLEATAQGQGALGASAAGERAFAQSNATEESVCQRSGSRVARISDVEQGRMPAVARRVCARKVIVHCATRFPACRVEFADMPQTAAVSGNLSTRRVRRKSLGWAHLTTGSRGRNRSH